MKNIFKAELKRRGIGYKELAGRLGAIGVPETPAAIGRNERMLVIDPPSIASRRARKVIALTRGTIC